MILQVPPSSTELAPAALSVLQYFRACVGRKVCQCLIRLVRRKLACAVGGLECLLPQMAPELPGFGEKVG